jgi:hypothetical protein
MLNWGAYSVNGSFAGCSKSSPHPPKFFGGKLVAIFAQEFWSKLFFQLLPDGRLRNMGMLPDHLPDAIVVYFRLIFGHIAHEFLRPSK